MRNLMNGRIGYRANRYPVVLVCVPRDRKATKKCVYSAAEQESKTFDFFVIFNVALLYA